MIALFNKADQGLKEFRGHVPHIDASEKYSKLKPYAERESNSVRQLISPELYDRAKAHYLSGDYGNEDQADITLQKLDRLVYLIQAPVAVFAYLKFAPNNDIIHSRNGRRTHWDENSKPANEWQIERQESQQFQEGHTAVNDLLLYIEEEREVFTEWKNSDQRAKIRGLFIQDAEQWKAVHPLGSSRWLFIQCEAFFTDYMETLILATVGEERYNALLEKLKNNTGLDAADKLLLSRIRKPLGLHALVRALREMPVQLLPDAIVQNYVSERLSLKARQVAATNPRLMVAQELEHLRDIKQRELEDHITALEVADQDPEEEEDISCDSDDQFFIAD